MPYAVSKIAEVVQGKFLSQTYDDVIEMLAHDSRRILQPAATLFFALQTEHSDGHAYLSDAFEKGVRNFIVSDEKISSNLGAANVILVADTVAALQQLAAFHRTQFSFPVIGITGSNGKTVVKEWLYQLLQDDFKIVRSPKSFNSQIGVPLSVWQMNQQHNLAIIEAGISKAGEMKRLQKIIQPTITVLTNIGAAHDAGFHSREEKLHEKLKLAENAQVAIGNERLVKELTTTTFSIGEGHGATLRITSLRKNSRQTLVTAIFKDADISIAIPFSDDASIHNAITCWAVLLYLEISNEVIAERILQLHPVDMRLQLRQGINGCTIINDSYSADTTSLRIALSFLQQQSAGRKSTVILSEFFESGKDEHSLYREIISMLKSSGVNRLIAVGEKFLDALADNNMKELTIQYYTSTENLLHSFRSSAFADEIILIKGARKFHFEQVVELFEKKLHQTVLEINLNAVAHNLKQFKSLLKPTTKVMAMVKAFSYGSGAAEIASVLQFHKVDYLGVAYADEGAELVRSGINIPIMVMNAEPSSFHSIVDYNLQPVIYSMALLNQFETFLNKQALSSYPVHLELETGMNRLGLSIEDVDELSAHMSASSSFVIKSVFTHLAASEDPVQDAFTTEQLKKFQQAVALIDRHVNYPYLKHIANTSAIVRHPQLQMDMVRLGIGLYGVDTGALQEMDLQPVATLRSTISQLKAVKKGNSVSYNRRGVAQRDSIIATVRIGYADGYSRQLSNGIGKMLVQGTLVPVIGSVCMDMTMLDVTDIPGVAEGDEVIVFGQGLQVEEVAKWAGTIPYEVMTSISQRVKRVYFFE